MIELEAVPFEKSGTAFKSSDSHSCFRLLSKIGSELPVSSAELITDSMFKKLTSLPFLSKTRETFPRDRLADTQATTCSIKASDIKNMNDFGSETRFYRG